MGHESDTTVIDLVADHRASTPTQAMMAVLPDREELRQQLQGVAGTLELRVRQVLRRASDRLDAVRSRPCLRDASGGIRMPRERLRMVAARLAAQAPMARLAAAREGVAGLVRRIGLAAARQRSDRASRLRALSDRLASVSPTQVLARGYSITLSEAGRTVRSAADVAPGQVLRTRLHAGEIRSRVVATSGCRGVDDMTRSVPDDPSRWEWGSSPTLVFGGKCVDSVSRNTTCARTQSGHEDKNRAGENQPVVRPRRIRPRDRQCWGQVRRNGWIRGVGRWGRVRDAPRWNSR
ncbi:MAG: hypothetical protein EB037_05845 [Actinobacteria bacterium]|nr:hypothetical protein [Actinomycetota bacterium]